MDRTGVDDPLRHAPGGVIEDPAVPTALRAPPRTARLVAGVLAIVVGLAGVVAPIATGGVAKAVAGEDMLDGARDSATREGSARLRADADLLVAGGSEVLERELPAVGAALGLSPAQLDALLVEQYPGIAAGIAGFPDAAASLEGIVTNLERQSDDYERADALPIGAISLTAAAIATMLTAALVAGFGVLVVRRATRVGLVALVVVSGLAVGWILVTQSPQKAAAAERVLDSLNLTGDATEVVVVHFDTTAAFLGEDATVFLADAADALGMTPEALRTELDARHPAAARLRTAAAAAALENIGEDVEFRRDNEENFLEVRGEPLAATVWAITLLFALVALAAVVALTASRSRESVAAP